MARESRDAKRRRAAEAFSLLEREYPDARCALDHRSPYQLGVATILSAQTTDRRVNMVTPELFERYPTPRDLAGAEQGDVEKIIRTTGFFRNKAKNIIGFAQGVSEEHGGEVPQTMADLTGAAGRRTQDRQRHPGQRVRNRRRGGRRYSCEEALDAPRIHEREDAGEDRARPHEALPEAPVDPARAPAHLPRPQGLRRPEAALRGVRRVASLPVVTGVTPTLFRSEATKCRIGRRKNIEAA